MQKDLLIIKNITRETPAGIQPLLEEQHDSFDVIELDKGGAFPDIAGYKALIVLGGPDSANDQTPKMLEEIKHVRHAIEAGMPYLGICLGLQVLVKAMGGSVIKSSTKEVGFRDPMGELFSIELTEAGKADPLLQGISSPFKSFELHGEMVELAPGMELLGKGKWCVPQIVKVCERAYGFQCHFEVTQHLLETLLKEDPDLSKLDHDQVRTDFAIVKDEYAQTARQIIQNFLKIAGVS